MENTFKPLVRNSSAAASGFPLFARLTKVLIGILLFALLTNPDQAFAVAAPVGYSATLAWDTSPSPEVVGYRVYYGVRSRDYLNSIDVETTRATITGLVAGTTYFFSVTSYDVNGQESPFSDEISYTPGLSTVPTRMTLTGQSTLRIEGGTDRTYGIEATEDLTTWTNIGTVTLNSSGTVQFTDTNAVNFSQRFYRTRDSQP